MARQLTRFKRTSRPGPDEKYPWDQWLDGKTWELVQGEDFDCEITTMADNVRRHARERKILISVFRESDDTLVITPRDLD